MSEKIRQLQAESRNDSYNSFSAAINSREQLTPNTNSQTYAIELKELKRKEAGDYDPYDHQDIEHPTTNFETLIHLLKSSFGTGILAMPLAFYHSGYVLGLIGTALIGLLCTYCMHMLIRSEYELCKRKKVPSLTYPGTAEAALSEGPPFLQKLAPYSGFVSNAFLLVYQLGSCCVYTVFVGQNIAQVINIYYEIDERYVMLMILLPLILMNYIRNLKFLAPLTTFANLVTVISFGIIYYYIFSEEVTFEDRLPVGDVKNWPLFIGTVLFALESIGMVLPLQHEMKHRDKFGSTFGVLNIGMVTVVIMYILTGLFGYLAFGSTVLGSISLTINPNDKASQACKLMLALAIFVSHSLFMYVATDIIWVQNLQKKFENNKHAVLWEYVFRTVLVCFTFSLAVAVPYIDLFISLVGALCISMLGVAFPAIFDSSLRWNHLKGFRKVVVHTKNLVIVIFSIIGLVVGVSTSLKEIINKFNSEN